MDDEHSLQLLLRWTSAFSRALMWHVREECDLEAEMQACHICPFIQQAAEADPPPPPSLPTTISRAVTGGTTNIPVSDKLLPVLVSGCCCSDTKQQHD